MSDLMGTAYDEQIKSDLAKLGGATPPQDPAMDQAVKQELGLVAPAAPAAPAASDPIDSAVKQVLGGTSPASALSRSMTVGTSRNPDEYAKVLDTAAALNLHPSTVEGNLPQAQEIRDRAKRRLYVLLSDSPAVAQFLSNPDNASVAHDDLEHLTNLEAIWRGMPKKFSAGVSEAMSGSIKAMRAAIAPWLFPKGSAADTHDDLIDALDEQASVKVDESNLFKKAIGETAGFLPILGGTTVASILGGPAAGVAVGASYFGATTYGSVKYDMAKFRDDKGRPVPEELQQAGAIAAGAAAAAVGALNISKILKVIPGADAIFKNEAAAALARLLSNPSKAAVIRQRFQAYGEAALTSGLASGAMTASSAAAEHLATSLSGQNVDLPTFRQEAAKTLDSFYGGVLIGGVVGLPGTALGTASDLVRVSRAKVAQAQMEAVGEAVKTSKLMARAPAKVGELAQTAVEAGAAPEQVFIPSEAFDNLSKAKGLDPEVAADQLGIERKYTEAKIVGGDVAIPFPTYVEKIAGTDLHAEAIKDMRLDPGDLTPREADELQKAQAAMTPEERAAQAPAETVPRGTTLEEITASVVDEAAKSIGDDPIFKTAADASATPEEYAAYVQSAERARAEASAELAARTKAASDREKTATWLEEEAKTQVNVEAEFNQRPEYMASYFLRTGKMVDGSNVPDSLGGADPLRIDPREIDRLYGPISKRIKAALRPLTKSGGASADSIAEQFGYGSGREMIDAIIRERPSDSKIKAEVTNRMLAKHGDLLSGVKIEEGAQAILHDSAERTRRLVTETRFLERQTRAGAFAAGRASPISMEHMRDQAAKSLRDELVRWNDPRKYREAERMAYQRVIKAMEAHEYPVALQAQRERISAFATYLEAVKAKDAAEKSADFIRQAGTDASRARLGKAGGTHLDQQDKLLERFEFRRGITPAADDRRQALSAWVADHISLDLDPAVTDQLQDETYRKHWKNLTNGELADLRDAVENIRTQARRQNEILAGDKKVAKAQARDEITGRLKMLPRSRQTLSDPNRTDAAANWERSMLALAQGDASLLRIETIVDLIDGKDPEGPMHRYLLDGINKADTDERDWRVTLGDILEEHRKAMPEAVRGSLLDLIPLPELGLDENGKPRSMTRLWMISMALNMGNESNETRLESHAPRGFQNWGPDVTEKIVSRLSQAEWDFVQTGWNLFKKIKPEIDALEKRRTGLGLKEIAPTSFTRKFADGTEKTYAGGYYPIVSDREMAPTLPLQQDELFDRNYGTALSPNGHVKERAEDYNAPILLDFGVLPRALNAQIHDLTHRETLLSIRSLLTDPEIRAAMYERLGPGQTEQFMPWLRYIANKQTELATGNEGFIRYSRSARTNLTASIAGFRAVLPLVHLVGYVQALPYTGAVHLAEGLRDFVSHPQDMTAWIDKNSAQQRHYIETSDRDVSQAFEDLRGRVGMKAAVQRFGIQAFNQVRRFLSYPIWLASYRKSLQTLKAEQPGKDPQDAHDVSVRSADSVVRKVLGSAAPKDLAAVQRGSEIQKWFTMFYSWESAMYQQAHELATDTASAVRTNDASNVPAILARSLAILAVPALLSPMLRGRKKPDDEGWFRYLATQAALWPATFVPFARSAVGYIETGRDIEFEPLGDLANKLMHVGEGIPKAWEGTKDPAKEALDIFRLSGQVTVPFFPQIDPVSGFPTDAPGRSMQYMWDWHTGKETPKGAWDVLNGIIYGPTHKQAGGRRR